MNITNALRKYVNLNFPRYICTELLSIANKIDEEHEKIVSRAGQLLADAEKDRDYNYDNWQDCKQKVLQANITINELNAKIESLEEELSHSVELPKDANEEIIRVGDMIERLDVRGHVIALMLSEYPKKWGGGLHWSVQLEGEKAPTALDAFFRHCPEPTVKDMLREMVDDWDCAADGEDKEAVLNEYAAKLRLEANR